MVNNGESYGYNRGTVGYIWLNQFDCLEALSEHMWRVWNKCKHEDFIQRVGPLFLEAVFDATVQVGGVFGGLSGHHFLRTSGLKTEHVLACPKLTIWSVKTFLNGCVGVFKRTTRLSHRNHDPDNVPHIITVYYSDLGWMFSSRRVCFGHHILRRPVLGPFFTRSGVKFL